MSEQTPQEGGLGGLLGKAKEFASDERIDAVADKIKGLTPDSIDSKIDAVADKAKELNN